jgi:DNA-binding SARP family transcriptional activator
MQPLSVRLLGGLEVRYAGQQLNLGTWKGAALLARLACARGRPVTRDHIQNLCWPETDRKRAQANLRFTLHRLRGSLSGPACAVIKTSSLGLWLDPDWVEVDLWCFEAAAGRDDLQSLSQAADLYRGDLLAGFEAPGVDFEDWLSPEREQLRRRALAILWSLFTCQRDSKAHETALATANRYLTLDPLCERMHAEIMTIHLARGDRTAALSHYRAASVALAKNLEVEPGPELFHLAELAHEGAAGVNRRIQGRQNGRGLCAGCADAARDRRPTVSVRPFSAMPDTPRVHVLAAALAEDISLDLARFRDLSVMAPNGLHSDAGPAHAIDYRLDGHVRLTGHGLKLGARLTEAASGEILWATRLRGELEDAPILVEAAVREAAATIPGRIFTSLAATAKRQPIRHLGSHNAYLLGRELMRGSHAERGHARKLFEHALGLDPEFAAPYRELALCAFYTCDMFDDTDWAARLATARDHAARAVSLDPADHRSHAALGFVLRTSREFEAARWHFDRCMELNGGDSETLSFVGLEYALLGDPERAVSQTREALRLNPGGPANLAEQYGKALFVAGRYMDALAALKHAEDDLVPTPAWMAAAAAYEGKTDLATRYARKFLHIAARDAGPGRLNALGGPRAWLLSIATFQDGAAADHYEHGLVRAGIGN